MARIRTIKPDFFKSEDVAALPFRTRLTWIGLWTHCDDSGRAKDNVRLIKAELWPLDNVSLNEVEEDLAILAANGRIVRYEVGGKRYLEIINFGEHQVINRPSPSKFPGSDLGTLTSDSLNSHGVLTEDSHQEGKGREGKGTSPADAGGQSAPTSSPHPGTVTSAQQSRNTFADGRSSLISPNTDADSGRKSERNANVARRSQTKFDEFWSVYPRKVGKKAARRRWDAAVKDADPDAVIAAAKRYATHVNGTEPRFIANPETWLNQGRWDDQLPAQGQGEVSPLWRGADL